jgi:hypothetical protein
LLHMHHDVVVEARFRPGRPRRRQGWLCLEAEDGVRVGFAF